jgi:putative hydrolase of the HAD superfamily
VIRTVIFDWGGVLTRGEYDRTVAHDVAVRAGREDLEEEIYRAWRAGKRLACERGEGTMDDAWRELASQFDLPGTGEQFASLLRDAIVPEPAVLDLLPPLRTRVSLGLLSNNYPIVSAIVRKSVGAYFDRLLFSNETCRVKPDQSAYEEALGALGASPAETLFVDDKERNLVPARAMGIQVHRFTDPPALRGELTARGLLVA